MDKLEGFVVRAESPRHFVLLAMQLAIPETAQKRLAVRTLAAPGWGFWARWLEALPPLYSAREGLQHILISGGPTCGCFRAWTDGPYDDMARFCFEMEWHGSPPAPDGVRAIELTSPFYRLHTLCDELKAARVSRVVVEGDPGRVVVPDDYWYQLLARLPAVEELWLYPGAARDYQGSAKPAGVSAKGLPGTGKGAIPPIPNASPTVPAPNVTPAASHTSSSNDKAATTIRQRFSDGGGGGSCSGNNDGDDMTDNGGNTTDDGGNMTGDDGDDTSDDGGDATTAGRCG
ncbi:hypothetical protein EDB84DRAFT_1558097 [Lactarius hengduanensis]|nr:hypothetical protein EDB84DRAFT_1558097 [Lactarius hengduanensis]